MRKLLDPAHMASQGLLDRGDRKQTAIKRTVLLTRIALDIVEVHAWQATVGGLDVNLEVLVSDRAEHAPAVL